MQLALSKRYLPQRVAAGHLGAKICKFADFTRRTGVIRPDATRIGGETVGEGYLEGLQRFHLPIEPLLRVRTQAIGPAQASPQVGYAKLSQATNRALEPMVLEMEPL